MNDNNWTKYKYYTIIDTDTDMMQLSRGQLISPRPNSVANTTPLLDCGHREFPGSMRRTRHFVSSATTPTVGEFSRR